jgi:hypothetical protein
MQKIAKNCWLANEDTQKRLWQEEKTHMLSNNRNKVLPSPK